MPNYGVIIPVGTLLRKLAKSQTIGEFVTKYYPTEYFDEVRKQPLEHFIHIVNDGIVYDMALCLALDPSNKYVFVGGWHDDKKDIQYIDEQLEKHDLLEFQPMSYEDLLFTNLEKEKLP